MKTLCFINPSKTIQRLLSEKSHSRSTSVYQEQDWQLKFSTFKSEDYRFFDELPRIYNRGQLVEDSIDLFGDQLESEKELDYCQNQEIEKQEKKGPSKRLCFRNSRATIMKCLQQKIRRPKKLRFSNNSEVIERFFPKLSKAID